MKNELEVYKQAFDDLYNAYYTLTGYKCYSKELILKIAEDKIKEKLKNEK